MLVLKLTGVQKQLGRRYNIKVNNITIYENKI